MAKRIDRTGCIFGRLTVLGDGPGSGNSRTLICKCKCGVERAFNANAVIYGSTKSCGCYKREVAGLNATVSHGHSRLGGVSSAYTSWRAMKARCENEKHPAWPRYGGAGISFTDRWKSFENFLADMGEPPGAGYTLERERGSEGYSKSNCKWATRSEQNRNRNSTVVVEFNGTQQRLIDLADAHDINPKLVRERIRRGWSVEFALKTKPKGK